MLFRSRLVALFPKISVSDPRLRQQAELLSSYTAFVLIRPNGGADSARLKAALLKSSLTLLSLREEAGNVRSRSSTLTGDIVRLKAKLEESKNRLEEQRRTIDNSESSIVARGSETPKPAAHWSHTPPASRSRSAFGEKPKSKNPQLGVVLPERDDLEYATSLQLKFDEENLALVAERDLVIQDAERTFICDICSRNHSYDSAMLMNPCEHTICPACLRTHVVGELNERHFPVHCPACRLNPATERGFGGVLFRWPVCVLFN